MSSCLYSRKISPQFSILAAGGIDIVLRLALYISTITLWYFITSPTTIQITIGASAVLAITTLSIKDLYTMSSPKTTRTPLKPTDKTNGAPKSPDSIKKMASTQPDADNVVKKRVPSQNVKTNAPTVNKPASPQTPRSKPPKSSENDLPQTPTPDRSSKRQPMSDAPPPKFKAAASSQGDAAKPVIKKVKKASPPSDFETEKRDHADGAQNEVKRAKKQAPPLQQKPEKFQNDAEKPPKPKFKAPDLDIGETPKPVVKKKGPTAPPPQLEPELEHQDEAVSDPDEVEQGNEDEGENDYHEESGHEEVPEQGDSEEEGHNGEEAGSDWDREQETHDDDGDNDYEGHGTDGEQDTQSQHGDKSSDVNEEANNPAPITNRASKATEDIKHKAQKATPATSGTMAAKNSELLEDLVAEPDAVFEDDADSHDVSRKGVSSCATDSQGADPSRVAENATLLRSGGGGAIGITANGIEINVQTTKEGTSVTIKIPSASQQ
ncbi:hypothetical protein V496_04125 [Pseudogymnoascus sp. VKM F-4515 (FW-2607)]|nr:hypothetical protein V496_04125 [Pseudogymnoascus sp. VKM F-4515 (FW-2607)]KFY93425.1 hypothetical protein V498_04439 [Pseudogymnoascus sp. VKM F-4517 (FW-2822)]